MHQQSCPVLTLAQKYEVLAKQWFELDAKLDTTGCYKIQNKLVYLALCADHLKPESITGARFQIECALSEMDAVVHGGDAPQIRLASERRVMKLLRQVLIFLDERSADLPHAWKFVVPAGDGPLRRKYGSD